MAAPTFTLVKTAPGGVSNAPAGKIRVFANVNNSMLYTIDEFGAVRPNGVGLATDLATTGDPVNIDSAGAPQPGWVLTATAGPSSPIAIWQPNTSVTVVAEQTGAIGVVALGDLILVEISAGGNATLTLPDAAGGLNEEIWVKMTSVANSNTITITPDAGDTIDGAATYVLTTDHEWVKLRSDGTNWMQVG